ncbi:hypothetical protein [Streptomyces regalis]|uniref:hypothetical protein n=1 Tax=Streptomyces regalis TaxID=68262 RepID=UPI000ABD87EC|nr:hypothetical protein [Streptomyces regalis]
MTTAVAVDIPATELCDAQRAATNQALRTILSAHRFWITDGLLGEALSSSGSAPTGGPEQL